MVAATDSLVLLVSVPEEVSASAITALLEEHGVRAIATGGSTAGFRAEAPGWVQVRVAEEDYALASSIVQEQWDDKHSVDWDQVDIGEPNEVEIEPTAHLLQNKYWRYLAVAIILLAGIGILIELFAIIAGL